LHHTVYQVLPNLLLSTLQVLKDFQVMHALYGAFKVHVMPDGALPPYLDGKQAYYGHYIFTTSPNPSSQMSLVAHSEAFKQAYQEAGYTENGQVTHRPRHEVPTDLRLKFSVSGEDISVLGSWDYSTKNQVYARLPPANLLAIMSGCPSRHNYTVLWALWIQRHLMIIE